MGIRVRDSNICTNKSMYDIQFDRELHIIVILKQCPFRTSVKLIILVHTYTHQEGGRIGQHQGLVFVAASFGSWLWASTSALRISPPSGLWGSKAGTGMQLSGSRHVKNCPPPYAPKQTRLLLPFRPNFFLGFRLSLPRSRPRDLFTRRLRRPIFGTFLGLDPNAH